MTAPIDPLTPEELRACGERAAAATAGPWFHRNAGVRVNLSTGEIKLADCPVALHGPSHPEHAGGFADAAFIAAARTDVPRLLATVAARDAELARLRAAWAEAQNKVGDLSTVVVEAGIAGSSSDLGDRALMLERATRLRAEASQAAAREAVLVEALQAAAVAGTRGDCGWCKSLDHEGYPDCMIKAALASSSPRAAALLECVEALRLMRRAADGGMDHGDDAIAPMLDDHDDDGELTWAHEWDRATAGALDALARLDGKEPR